jgi:hypothetical protein
MPQFRLPRDFDDLAMLSIDHNNAELDNMAFDSTIYERINGGNTSQFHSFVRETETDTNATRQNNNA